MSKLLIPPHLKVAETVTEEEYRSGQVQSKVLLIVALFSGIIFFFLFPAGVVLKLCLAGFTGFLVEKLMHVILKDAHKVKTHRLKHYKELKAFKERHGIED